MKGQSQAPPDGTHLYSDELFPHSQNNPTPMSYTVINKLADKHKYERVQTDERRNRDATAHSKPHMRADRKLCVRFCSVKEH